MQANDTKLFQRSFGSLIYRSILSKVAHTPDQVWMGFWGQWLFVQTQKSSITIQLDE